jgi:hypothetical protein
MGQSLRFSDRRAVEAADRSQDLDPFPLLRAARTRTLGPRYYMSQGTARLRLCPSMIRNPGSIALSCASTCVSGQRWSVSVKVYGLDYCCHGTD